MDQLLGSEVVSQFFSLYFFLGLKVIFVFAGCGVLVSGALIIYSKITGKPLIVDDPCDSAPTRER
jgi:hypothetical protein